MAFLYSPPSSASGSSTYTISSKTANYTVISTDLGKIINCSGGNITIALTAAATLGAGFNCWIWNTNTIAYSVTIDPNASETINGATTLVVTAGSGIEIVCDGTNWLVNGMRFINALSTTVSPTALANASGSSAVALGPSSTASGTGSSAFGYGASAGAQYSVAIGTNSGFNGSVTATGLGSTAIGGSYASGIDSFAAAIGSNLSTYGATGSTGPVAIGNNNKASGSYATSVGGYQNLGSANWSMALGGRSCTAAYEYSIAYGYVGTPNAIGKVAFGHASGIGAGIGWGTLNLYRATTDATPTILTSDNTAAGSTNQLVLPNNSAYTFSILVVARQSAAGGTASAVWKIEGLIRQEGTAASTTLVNYITTVISNVPGWTIAVSADTTNGGLAITATGAAATNIRWVATAQTSEVTYA
jgi:hypothetical protein